MHRFALVRAVARTCRDRTLHVVPIAVAALIGLTAVADAQGVDCGRLQTMIAQAGRDGGGNRNAGPMRKQAVELSRTQAYAHQLGCDGFSFFGGNPQCDALKQRVKQLQAGLSQMQAGGGGGGGRRAELVAQFNAYCRQAQPQQPRGFFESIFGGGEQPRQAPLPELGPDDPNADPGDGSDAHGGSQAVCVRTCDGGFFPLGVSARHGGDNLAEMCSALCPGTEATVYTRNPDSEIKTAVSLDGKPYMDLPNALKFSKAFTPACSCRPAGKTWAEALANAEEVIGNSRKGDIVVTQAKSDELSRPKLDPKTRSSLLKAPATAMVSPEDASQIAGDAAKRDAPTTIPADPTAIAPAEGVKRAVRRVGPQP
jgi:predicted RNase H-like HicB family nuclease